METEDFAPTGRETITILATSGLRQSRKKYEELTLAVENHKPDVVAICGDFLEDSRLEIRDRLPTYECARKLGQLDCHELILTMGYRDRTKWNYFKGFWPDEGIPFCMLQRKAKRLQKLITVGFPCRWGRSEAWQSYYSSFRRWFSPILEEYRAAARSLWLLPDPPSLGMHHFPEGRQEWAKAIEKFLPKVVLIGSGLNTPPPDKRRIWLTRKNTALVSLTNAPYQPLHYCVMEITCMGNVPTLPSEVSIEIYPSEESFTINGEYWRI